MRPLATHTFELGARFLVAAVTIAAFGLARPALALDWQIEISPAGELFPALQLSQRPRTSVSVAGDGDGLISVRVPACRSAPACSPAPQRLRLQIDTPGLRTPAILEATRDPKLALVLHPRLDWDVGALRSLRATRTQHMRVSLDGDTREVEVRLHTLDDALYFVREGGDRVDLGWAFAGYVSPYDPGVDEVLALARSVDPDFSADVTTDPATNLRRVGTVWAALEKHGVRYASDNPAMSQGPRLYSQRVRLPADTWRERRANCIDGSVLIASVLERLGIRSFIVLVPGHAFLRFDTGTTAHYLETTALGATGSGSLAAAVRDIPGAHFAAALAAGTAHWRRAAARLDGRHGPDYALIDIETARSYGIIPMLVGRDDGDRPDGHATRVDRSAAAPVGSGN